MENWRHQFIIFQNEDPSKHIKVTNWYSGVLSDQNRIYFCAHESLPKRSIQLNDGYYIIFGWPINLEKEEIISDGSQLDCDITDIAGRFVAYNCNHNKVYLDPLTNQPGIVDFQENAVASSSGVVSGILGKKLITDEDVNLNINEHSNKFYPFGFLPFVGQKRLVCNHSYSFTDKTIHREWLPSKENVSVETQLKRIKKSIASIVNAYRKDGATQLALSAGKETRLMLACSMAFCDELEFITRFDFDSASEQDYLTAKHIAKNLNLSHTAIIKKGGDEISSEERQDWLARVGYCIGGNPLKSYNLIDHSLKPVFSMSGIGGEFARGFYWDKLPDSKDRITAEQLLNIANLPLKPAFVDEAKRFLNELPREYSNRDISDIFYLESRIACFGSPHKYGCIKGINFVYPFSSRQYLAAAFNVPNVYKENDLAFPQIIREQSEFLGRLPYNSPLNLLGWFKPFYIKKFIKTILRTILKQVKLR
jgi:hypothetical protein